MRLHESVKFLVKAFGEHELPSSVYIATRCLINELWGISAENVFIKYAKHDDEAPSLSILSVDFKDKYYIHTFAMPDCMKEMQEAAVIFK